ncbi:MAG: pyrroloquinoline quinone biosynthesis peptide chaperone PqqD [Pseudomonadota bacterium]|nr:pyrroloquinoline quinone biosynthesis peptide chaperone PqqD [Pseudomonadota bacterium]
MVQSYNPEQGSSGRGVIRLAPGIRLHRDGKAASLLVLRAGKAHLNKHALAILELCDGSRSRTQVVMEAILGAGTMRAADVADFLDAARARGWIIEDD